MFIFSRHFSHLSLKIHSQTPWLRQQERICKNLIHKDLQDAIDFIKAVKAAEMYFIAIHGRTRSMVELVDLLDEVRDIRRL